MSTKQHVESMLITMGKFIRQKRMALGLSQEELAARANLHRTYVSDVERGNRNITIGAAVLIAEGLEIEWTELMMAMGSPASRPLEEEEKSLALTSY